MQADWPSSAMIDPAALAHTPHAAACSVRGGDARRSASPLLPSRILRGDAAPQLYPPVGLDPGAVHLKFINEVRKKQHAALQLKMLVDSLSRGIGDE